MHENKNFKSAQLQLPQRFYNKGTLYGNFELHWTIYDTKCNKYQNMWIWWYFQLRIRQQTLEQLLDEQLQLLLLHSCSFSKNFQMQIR